MDNPLALQAILNSTPKTQHSAIMQAFEVGKRSAKISHQNETREALRALFQIADMDVENDE